MHIQPLHASDTSWIVNSPNARLVLIDIDPHMADPPISSHHSSPRTTPIDWLKRRKKPDHQKKRVPRKEERWALRVWAPTDWQLGLLTYLSPVHVLLVWFVSDENWGTMVPLFLLNAGMVRAVRFLGNGRSYRSSLNAQLDSDCCISMDPTGKRHTDPAWPTRARVL